MNKMKVIWYLFVLVPFGICANACAQNRFDGYLSYYSRQVNPADSIIAIKDCDYMKFEFRRLNGFIYDDFLPKSIFRQGFENCYFMLTMCHDDKIVAMIKNIYVVDDIETAEYFFVLYNNTGVILDTLCLLAGRDTYKDIDDFFMSYIILKKNEIQHVCIGPFGSDDAVTNCKKSFFAIVENHFVLQNEESYNNVLVPIEALDIRI